MNWTEVTVKTTTEAVEAISNILLEERCGGVMIEDPKDFLFQEKNELDWDYVEEEVFNKSNQLHFLFLNLLTIYNLKYL